ncbi:putative proline-rich receptor-like protein kinase PERK6 [Phoenix dactylifera]|uniref:non-specific serine/threonine protein kinase n=1 Tax=Phoenix dactylifera TaxID=42345 RepID=A0A8B9AYX8_PHODC|nr:putative proline-rich receptor-like protein kinase PERK6 [Phoenix dactylifera]
MNCPPLSSPVPSDVRRKGLLLLPPLRRRAADLCALRRRATSDGKLRSSFLLSGILLQVGGGRGGRSGQGGKEEEERLPMVFTPEQQQYTLELDQKAASLRRSIQDLRLRIEMGPPLAPDTSRTHLSAPPPPPRSHPHLQRRPRPPTQLPLRHPRTSVGLPQAPKNVRLFSYNELKSAARNFHPTNRIGRGGFGVVYKGTLRDETEVAIKTLSAESKQGTNEFLTEIDMVSNIRHPNLVQLMGCCVEGRNRILVYEYLENNSLANALLGPANKRIALDWPKRAAICAGTAQGLAFLHEEAEPHIVHRDIKASNVLLDKDLAPKIGDFGLAKLFPDNVTHISTRVAGTIACTFNYLKSVNEIYISFQIRHFA